MLHVTRGSRRTRDYCISAWKSRYFYADGMSNFTLLDSLDMTDTYAMPDMRIPRAPRAKFPSTCHACGRPIRVGDAIVKHIDSRRYVHSSCQFNRKES